MTDPAARARGLAWALAVIGVLLVGVSAWRLWPVAEGEGADPARENEASRAVRSTPTRSLPGSAASPSSGPASVALADRVIAGQVVDPDAGPLSEGRVDLHCLDHGYQSSGRIDEDGRFVVPACARGPSCLRLVHPGFEQPEAWVLDEITPGVLLELEAAAATRVLGTVRSPSGAAVAGASLSITRGEARWTGSSDADGAFEIGLASPRACDACDGEGCQGQAEPGGAVVILVMAPGFGPIERVLDGGETGETTLELVLAEPAPALTGQILGRDGAPFDARTRVIARNLERPREQHAVVADADGRFAFTDLAVAEYSLRAIRDEREIAALGRARPGEALALNSEHPAGGAILTVAVVNAAGDPVAGARVDGGPFKAAISDSDGRVRAPAVIPGEYRIRARLGECEPVRVSIELEPSAEGWTRELQVFENC